MSIESDDFPFLLGITRNPEFNLGAFDFSENSNQDIKMSVKALFCIFSWARSHSEWQLDMLGQVSSDEILSRLQQFLKVCEETAIKRFKKCYKKYDQLSRDCVFHGENVIDLRLYQVFGGAQNIDIDRLYFYGEELERLERILRILVDIRDELGLPKNECVYDCFLAANADPTAVVSEP